MTDDQIKALQLSNEPTKYLPAMGSEPIPSAYRVEGLPEGYGAEVYIFEKNSRRPWAFRFNPALTIHELEQRFPDKDAALDGLRRWWRRIQPDAKR